MHGLHVLFVYDRLSFVFLFAKNGCAMISIFRSIGVHMNDILLLYILSCPAINTIHNAIDSDIESNANVHLTRNI